jgi:hypothetical protein
MTVPDDLSLASLPTTLETKLIFIDVCIFRNAGFNVQTSAFEQIRKLCNRRELFLYTTTITNREIGAQIKAFCDETFNNLNTFRKRTVKLHLFQRNFQKKISRVTASHIANETQKTVDRFLKSAKTTALPIPRDSVDRVFSKYFERQKPFGVGKKKSEFPDAFTIEALLALKKKLYVISADEDFDGLDPLLIRAKSLDEFLNLYNSHLSNIPQFIRDLVRKHQSAVVKWALEEFAKIPITRQGGEPVGGADVSLQDITDINVLSLRRNRAEVSLEILFHVSGGETDLGHWGAEVDAAFEEDVTALANIEITFDISDKDKFNVRKALMKSPSEITVDNEFEF